MAFFTLPHLSKEKEGIASYLPTNEIGKDFYYSVEPKGRTFKDLNHVKFFKEEKSNEGVQNIYEDPHRIENGTRKASESSIHFLPNEQYAVPESITDDLEINQHKRKRKICFFYVAFFLLTTLTVICFMLCIIHVFFPQLIDLGKNDMRQMIGSLEWKQNRTSIKLNAIIDLTKDIKSHKDLENNLELLEIVLDYYCQKHLSGFPDSEVKNACQEIKESANFRRNT